MANFLSSFLPNLWRLLIPIYDLQKKAKKFKWMDEAEKAFNEIKKLLVSPPVLKAPTPDGLFRLKSDTSGEGVGGTLLQMQTAFYWFRPCRDLLPVSLFCIQFPGFLVPRCALLFWGIFVRGLRFETFVRVLRSSELPLNNCK